MALNITQSGTNYPSMLLTSQIPTAGSVPASWDYTNPATNATQNVLTELEGGIVDAQSFGTNLVIYGTDQAWLMQANGSFSIYSYFKLPFHKGAINSNCVVEIDGQHYVFGPDDIWRHDGTNEQSLVSGRNRDYIFGSLNQAYNNRCFVLHNPALKELYFCYVSGDSLVNFTGVGGCNRKATYNYADDNWTFDDLPSVYSGTYAPLAATQSWATLTGTWATLGGSWQSFDQTQQRTTCYVGDTNATYNLTQQLYAFDLYGAGSTVIYPVDTNATVGAKLYRDGIDLDQVQGVDLPDYKLFSTIWPLARIDAAANTTLNIQFGSSDFYGQAATFDGPPMTFDGNTLYQMDYNMAGRYLSMQLEYNDYTTFSVSGFDFLIDETGQR